MWAALMALCWLAALSGCSRGDGTTDADNISLIADRVWAYGQSHPDGFTLDIRSMTEPTEGIAVSYAETQHSHSRQARRKIRFNFSRFHSVYHFD